MKKPILIILLLQMATGCVSTSGNPSGKILAVCFPTDPLDHKKGELIFQVEITASPASIYRIDKIPYDWSAEATFPDSFEVTCQLTGNHSSSFIADIGELNDVVYIRPTWNRKNLRVTARLAISEGRTGPSRILTLDSDQLALR